MRFVSGKDREHRFGRVRGHARGEASGRRGRESCDLPGSPARGHAQQRKAILIHPYLSNTVSPSRPPQQQGTDAEEEACACAFKWGVSGARTKRQDKASHAVSAKNHAAFFRLCTQHTQGLGPGVTCGTPLPQPLCFKASAMACGGLVVCWCGRDSMPHSLPAQPPLPLDPSPRMPSPYNNNTAPHTMVLIKFKTLQGKEFSVDGVQLTQTVRNLLALPPLPPSVPSLPMRQPPYACSHAPSYTQPLGLHFQHG